MNSGPSDQLPQCFLNVNWSGSTGHSSQFGSALSSLMPAQSATSAAPVFGASGNSSPKIGFSKLGHLQQLQPQAAGGVNVAASLSAMAHLDQFLADPSFAERAARFSSFDDQNYGLLSSQLEHLESNKQVPASNEVQFEVNNAALGIAKEETSASHPRSVSREVSFGCVGGSNKKKRKAPAKSKDKDVASSKVSDQEESGAKQHRAVESNNEIDDESVEPKIDASKVNGKDDEQKQGKENNAKPSEPPKDYIHVRARRGQATDSHSLAERVRREKISQRMKLLQDLVPGCSKVTGKAVMLDEIINYVQSLQRQVEFLSMKLATVNPHLDFDNLMSLEAKDMIQICGPLPSSAYPFEMSVESSYSNQLQERNTLRCALTNGMGSHSSMSMVDPTCHPNLNALKACLNGFGDDPSLLEALWGDDLQSVVHMGIGQNLEIAGTFPAAQMKTEL